MLSPVVTKAVSVMGNLILSARLMACDPALERYLDDTDYSELIV